MSEQPDNSRRESDGGRRQRDDGQTQQETLVLSDEDAYVGDSIVIKGRNLPANESFDLRWKSVHGEWGVLEAHEIVGPQYRPRTDTITTIETDDSGAFDWEFTIPEDYGGDHIIKLVDSDDTSVADAEIEVIPHFELLNETAELGDFFTIRGYGIGPDIMVNNYPVVWDNGYVGFMTGVQNRGTATAEIRAAGPPGKHVLQVWRSHLGIPFLQNNTQSPYGKVSDGRTRTWTVEVTEPETPPQTAWVDDLFQESPIELHYPDIDQDTAATLDITPECGQAGTSAIISGSDFPPHTEVDLIWYRHDGHEPQGKKQPPDHSIWSEQVHDLLPTVSTDSDGSFQVEIEIPVDVGSTRPITAAVDGREVAVTGFMMQPSIETFEPTSGPVGTEIEIELTGVGWTNYETTPMFVYDNDMLGYSCSLSGPQRTKLRTVLRASGQPGHHFIDVYPAIFTTEDDDPDFQLMPHLSYLDNHPVRPLPAAHFSFEVTE
ncbi:hypothetical protein [Salinibaculum salinum]|uniref:hypothetical protein n=1 Tax=Salinibaculum salinum TaxID=3131996 RepID=UPI0030EEFFAC